MKKLNQIVVGIDFSVASKSALYEAVRMAAWRNAVLHVLHVATADEVEALQKYDIVPIDQLCEDLKKNLRLLTDECADDESAVIEYHVEIGHPFTELVGLCERTSADLLVLGATGAGGRRNRAGMIATKCVRKAPASVMLVRSSHLRPFSTVVACVDFSDSSREAMEEAAVIAREEAAALHVIHAYYPVWLQPTDMLYDMSPVLDPEFQKAEREGMERCMKDFVTPLREAEPEIDIKTEVLERQSVSYAIADYLGECKADLAVVGSRGHSALRMFFLGTTAERIVHDSPCSVLTIRGKSH